MSTLRFLSNDGLDGILPTETVFASYNKLAWLAVILPAIALIYFLASNEKTTDATLQTSVSVKNKSNTIFVKTKKEEPTLIAKPIPIAPKPPKIIEKPKSTPPKPLITNEVKKPSALPAQIKKTSKKTESIALKEIKSDNALISITLANNKPTKDKATLLAQPYIIKFEFKQIGLILEKEASHLIQFVQQCGNKVNIVGHTCNMGEADYNHHIGLTRAIVIQKYLINAGISPDNLNVSSKGMDQPIADNATKSGRITNRRVELLCIDN